MDPVMHVCLVPEADIRFRPPKITACRCYRAFTDRRSSLVVADPANLIADLRVERSLLQRLA
jgi:hypothetical protein